MPPTHPPTASLDDLLVHRGWVAALARSLARDAASADDLAQQTWLRAIEAPPRAEAASGARGAGWLATVVRNLARDAHRRSVRRTARETASARPEGTPPTDRLVARAEAERRVIAAVLALDEPYRTVVLLRFFEDLPPRRIAQLTETNGATVRTRLHRALAMLRSRLGGDDPHVATWALALPAAAGSPLARVAEIAGGALVTTQKKSVIAAVLLLLVGGAVWKIAAVASGTESDERAAATTHGAAAPAEAPHPRSRAAGNETTAAGEAAPAEVGGATDSTKPAPAAPAAPKPERLAVHVLQMLPAPTGPDEFHDDRADPEKDDGPTIAVGGGTMRMAGWSRWKPVPPKGRVTWRGRVLDREGHPLAGATLLRVSLDASGGRASPASWEWVTEVTAAGLDGAFEATSQPDGPFLVTAKWHGHPASERGLDLTGSVRVEAKGDTTAPDLEIRLPVDTARLGGVRGRVVDEDGAPVPSAAVNAANDSAWTTSDGRFELAGLEPGDCVVGCDEPGFAPFRSTVTVRAGQVAETEIRLTLALRGTLEISGRVTDDAGAAVPSMRMFLTDGSIEGIRYVTSGADGRYRFAHLPDSWAKAAIAVMPVPMATDAAYLQERREDVRAPDLACDFVLRRMTSLRLLIRSADDGAAVPLFNLDARLEIPGEPVRQLQTSTEYEETGEQTIQVARGRLLLKVEAKGHRGVEVAIEVPDADGPKEAEIRLARE